MPEHKGTVAAKSEYGIKFSDNGPWFNWAREDKQGTPFHDVSKGDSVRMEYGTYDKKDGSKGYNIYVIENLSNAAPVGDAPFPPDEGFPGDEAGTPFPSGTTEAPSAATIDKDRLIVRQVCVKAACEALAISPLDTEEKAGRITYLAGELEDWIFRS
jgi:hypothetical protein